MITLFGEYIETNSDYAKRLIVKGMNAPTYKIKIRKLDFEKFHLSYTLQQLKEELPQFKVFNGPGIYVIYDGHPGYQGICLYVGNSENSIYDRVRRFLQGITGTLRPDENHPAGTKCYNRNVSYRDLYIKFLPKSEFPETNSLVVDQIYIDEYVAPMLKSQFNHKIKR